MFDFPKQPQQRQRACFRFRVWLLCWLFVAALLRCCGCQAFGGVLQVHEIIEGLLEAGRTSNRSRPALPSARGDKLRNRNGEVASRNYLAYTLTWCRLRWGKPDLLLANLSQSRFLEWIIKETLSDDNCTRPAGSHQVPFVMT